MAGICVFSCYWKSKLLCLLKKKHEAEQSLNQQEFSGLLGRQGIGDWAQIVQVGFQDVSKKHHPRAASSAGGSPLIAFWAKQEASSLQ